MCVCVCVCVCLSVCVCDGETVTTDESVVKEYNPYREAELMGG